MERDEEEIRELVARWMAATKAGDIQTVLSLMTEDVVFLVPGHPPMIGKAAYASASAGQGPMQFDGASEIREIKIFGEWAFMWQKLTVVVTPPSGKKMTRSGHTLSVFKKEKNKWLLARDANLLSGPA
jgi:uncharacterized protein (TIGR02246 family)